MRRLQFQLRRNAFLVCSNCRIYRCFPILTLEDGGDGGNSSTSPASGNSKTTLAAPQRGDNVDASQPAYPLNSRTEEVSKNYIIHETSQDEPATRPLWKDTMAAMFGDHVKWEDMKAYVSRGRPLCKLCIPYRIFESKELYSSTCAAVFHNWPPCTIRRSPYQTTLRYTSSLSYTHDDFEPRICLESRTWLLSNSPGKLHSFHDSGWICTGQW
jgi:hypothetical protein